MGRAAVNASLLVEPAQPVTWPKQGCGEARPAPLDEPALPYFGPGLLLAASHFIEIVDNERSMTIADEGDRRIPAATLHKRQFWIAKSRTQGDALSRFRS